MRDIILDVTPFEEKSSVHHYLKEMFRFPFYYGANLDALYDELSSETEQLHITLIFPKTPRGKMVEYLPRLIRVFEDSAKANYHLEIIYQEGSL